MNVRAHARAQLVFRFEAEEIHKDLLLLVVVVAIGCNLTRRPAAGGGRPSFKIASDSNYDY